MWGFVNGSCQHNEILYINGQLNDGQIINQTNVLPPVFQIYTENELLVGSYFVQYIGNISNTFKVLWEINLEVIGPMPLAPIFSILELPEITIEEFTSLNYSLPAIISQTEYPVVVFYQANPAVLSFTQFYGNMMSFSPKNS